MIYLVSFEPKAEKKGNITNNSIKDYDQARPEKTMAGIFVIGDHSSAIQIPDNPVFIALKKNGHDLRPEQCEFAGRQFLGLQLATNNYHGGGELEVNGGILTLKGGLMSYGRYDRKIVRSFEKKLLTFFQVQKLILS